MKKINRKYAAIIPYLLLSILGLLILWLSSLVRDGTIPNERKEFSYFLIYHFTKPVGIIFFIVGFGAGYFLNLNPWKAGLSLFLVFPLTAIIEGLIYEGSHNLLPFELFGYFLYALPSIAAVFIGRFFARQLKKRRDKLNTAVPMQRPEGADMGF